MLHRILLDNTVLSNFTAVEGSALVQTALGELAATSDIVWAELQVGIRLGRLPSQDWSWLPVLTLTEAEQALYHFWTQRLNAGEASCLAIAAVRGYRIFTDDQDARGLAVERQIPVSGTLGLLMRLVDTKVIALSAGDMLLSKMIAMGYYSPVTSLRELF